MFDCAMICDRQYACHDDCTAELLLTIHYSCTLGWRVKEKSVRVRKVANLGLVEGVMSEAK